MRGLMVAVAAASAYAWTSQQPHTRRVLTRSVGSSKKNPCSFSRHNYNGGGDGTRLYAGPRFLSVASVPLKRPRVDKKLVQTLSGVAVLGAIDEAARTALAGTGAPHSLVAGSLLVVLLTVMGRKGAEFHDKILAPGSGLLLKWMAAFFMPNLITLPIAAPIASTAAEFAIMGGVVVGGLFATLALTALAALAVTPKTKDETPEKANPTAGYLDSIQKTKGPLSEAKPPPFGSPLLAPFTLGSLVSLAVLSTTLSPLAAAAYFALSTMAAYAVGGRLGAILVAWAANSKANVATSKLKVWALTKRVVSSLSAKIGHPVILGSGLATVAIAVAAKTAGLTQTVATELYAATGGAFLQRLLGPCVVALAAGVYARRKQIADSWRPVAAGVSAGALSGLYGTACLLRFLDLPVEAKIALLPRCVTSPLAQSALDAWGHDPAAAFAVIMITGIVGASLGPAFLSKVGATEAQPTARGLAMGAAAHGVGTAELVQRREREAQVTASISMALAGALAVALAVAPPSRALLFAVAGIPSGP